MSKMGQLFLERSLNEDDYIYTSSINEAKEYDDQERYIEEWKLSRTNDSSNFNHELEK
jgi:hypothetical protein